MDINPPASEVNVKYQKIFRGMDENKTGLVRVEDVVTTLRNMGNDVTESEIQKTLSKLTGSNQTRRIVFEEFVFLMVQLDMEIVEDDEFALVFQYLDKDGDGFILPDDLKELLVGMGQNISEKHLADMIKEADKDGDGKVSYEDFCNVMAVKEIKSENEPDSQIQSAVNSSTEVSTAHFETSPLDSSRILPGCTTMNSTGNRRLSFAAGAKRRMSCLLFGTPSVGKYSSSYQRRPRSRSSCGSLAALQECEFANDNGMPRTRRSFGSSPNFLRDLFKKK